MDKQSYGITGVSSGIGAHLAQLLKSKGHHIIGFDIKETTDHVDQFIPLDLNDEGSIDRAANALNQTIDGLFNNAGLPPKDGLEASILQVNFLGQRMFTKGVLPHLSAAGSIVNMASRAGHGWRENLDQVKRLASIDSAEELPKFVAAESLTSTRCYNLSKEAMIVWTLAETESMIKRDIRINSLSPGGISTGILPDFQRAFGDKMARNIERAGRPGEPQEIAAVAAFVLSRQSHWIKGTDIAIDGGMGAFGMCDQLELGGLKVL